MSFFLINFIKLFIFIKIIYIFQEFLMFDKVLFCDDLVLKGPGLFSANLNVLFSINIFFGFDVRVDFIDWFSSEGSDSYLSTVSWG
mgnify:CR=1 FL=1